MILSIISIPGPMAGAEAWRWRGVAARGSSRASAYPTTLEERFDIAALSVEAYRLTLGGMSPRRAAAWVVTKRVQPGEGVASEAEWRRLANLIEEGVLEPRRPRQA